MSSKKKSEFEKNSELISFWYQSYYLWNTTYMNNLILNSNTQTKFSQRSIEINPYMTIPTQSNSTSSISPQTPIPEVLSIYKVPSLSRFL
jgi:hypothetical protein